MAGLGMVGRRWVLVFAVVLAAQWSVAVAHCRLLWDEAVPFGSALCLAHGDGSKAPEHHPGVGGLECPACHQVPSTGAVAGPMVWRGVGWVVVAGPGGGAAWVGPPGVAPAYLAQGPPV